MPRTIPAGLLAHLQGEATGLVECVRITPLVGSVLAFTDFNESLTVDGTTFLPRPGMRVSQVSANLSLELDSSQAQSFFKTGIITRADVKNGKFRGATFERIYANFDDVSDGFYSFHNGRIGRVKVSDWAFQAEFIGRGQAYSQPVGFITSKACNWVQYVGDKYCKKSLAGTGPGSVAYTQNGTISGVTNAITFHASGIGGGTHWFDYGRLLWTSGPNDGYYGEIAYHETDIGDDYLVLMQAPGSDIAVGHTFTVEAGCDREYGTCATKFDNLDNFRGQPFLIGDRIYEPADAQLGSGS